MLQFSYYINVFFRLKKFLCKGEKIKMILNWKSYFKNNSNSVDSNEKKILILQFCFHFGFCRTEKSEIQKVKGNEISLFYWYNGYHQFRKKKLFHFILTSVHKNKEKNKTKQVF